MHNALMHQWIVDAAERLDAFLAKEGRMLSRARAQKAIAEKRVTVNGEAVTKSAQRVLAGDVIVLEEREETDVGAIEPADLHLKILYEDDACFVINKPAGIAVHPGAGMKRGEVTLLHGAAFLYKQRTLPFSPESVLVHRLDKETTGCMLIAKDPASHLTLQKQFEKRSVDKQYLALVAGVPHLPAATIDAPIGRSPKHRTKMSVRASAASRQAKTTYRVLAQKSDVALLVCDLHTGRTHQIRVHLHSIGHPVLGDATYASAQSKRLNEAHGIGILCLHAWKLSFRSPADEKEHAVQAELPKHFRDVLSTLGIDRKAL